jgi:hypothetical protein
VSSLNNTTARHSVRRAGKESIARIGIQRFCVLYRRDGKEHRSPWFASSARAHRACKIMANKYGQAIVYRD